MKEIFLKNTYTNSRNSLALIRDINLHRDAHVYNLY